MLPIMQNHMEKNMENYMETGVLWDIYIYMSGDGQNNGHYYIIGGHTLCVQLLGIHSPIPL